jgi:hypothetical protein
MGTPVYIEVSHTTDTAAQKPHSIRPKNYSDPTLPIKLQYVHTMGKFMAEPPNLMPSQEYLSSIRH